MDSVQTRRSFGGFNMWSGTRSAVKGCAVLLLLLLGASPIGILPMDIPSAAAGEKGGVKEVPAFTETLARELLPPAAEVDPDAALAAKKLGYKTPPINNARLTFIAAMWNELTTPSEKRDLDLRFLALSSDQQDAAAGQKIHDGRSLLAYLADSRAKDATSKAVSILRANALQRVVVHHEGVSARGRVTFVHPHVCDGQVDFDAVWRGDKWEIVSLRFPESNISTTLRQNRWVLFPSNAAKIREIQSAANRQSRKALRARRSVPNKGYRKNLDSLARQIDTSVNPEVARMLDNALVWLAAHQSPTGAWNASEFHKYCHGKLLAPSDVIRKPGIGKAHYDVGVTGLALQAFLESGYSGRGKHPFNAIVSKGLRYLKKKQDKEGCFGTRVTQQYVYCHAMAAQAMVEAYGLTGSSIYKSCAQRGLDFIALARNPYFAYRYGIRSGENDTSISGAMYLVFKAAHMINLRDQAAGKKSPFKLDMGIEMGVLNWLDKVTDVDYGRVGYQTRGTPPARPAELMDKFPAERSESMTAIALTVRLLAGTSATDPTMTRGLALLDHVRPTWDTVNGSIDMVSWYYGTQAKALAGGRSWHIWSDAMATAIAAGANAPGDPCGLAGSFDPAGPWGPDGGRVYSTALMAKICATLLKHPPSMAAAAK